MPGKSSLRTIIEMVSVPLYKLYNSEERNWKYRSLDITVHPDIFHPGWFATSKMLTEWMEETNFKNKRFLELGCGTGFHACLAAHKGAKAVASDILMEACRNAQINAESNHLDISIIHSDMFAQIPDTEKFDYICVNPPFSQAYPEKEADFAFCFGEGYEYYFCLFNDLARHLNTHGQLVMTLSSSCDLERIKTIASNEQFSHSKICTEKKWAEKTHLYSFFINSGAQ